MMTNELEYFKAVQRFNSTNETQRDREIREAKDHMVRELRNTMYAETIEVSGVEKKYIVVPDTNNTNEMIINAMPYDTFEIGEVIKYRDKHWLVTEKKQDEKIQCKGKMTLCNHLLRWQDFNDDIKECHCIITDPYSRQPRENEVTNHAYSAVTVYVPFNDDTKKMFVDQRFILWTIYNQDGREIPDVYKITDIKQRNTDYGDRHIITLSMSRDTSHEGDSIEHMIADYIPIESSTPTPENKMFCEFSIRDTIAVGGTRTAAPKFYKADKSIAVINSVIIYVENELKSERSISDDGEIKAVWRLYPSEEIEISDVELKEDGSAKFTISNNKSQIGGHIDITLEDELGDYQVQTKRIEVI